jgi:hypothetical protein
MSYGRLIGLLVEASELRVEILRMNTLIEFLRCWMLRMHFDNLVLGEIVWLGA